MLSLSARNTSKNINSFYAGVSCCKVVYNTQNRVLKNVSFCQIVTTLALRQIKLTGGEGGIRTHGTLARTTVFETVPIDHSGTSPRRRTRVEQGSFVMGRSLTKPPARHKRRPDFPDPRQTRARVAGRPAGMRALAAPRHKSAPCEGTN